MTTLSLSQAGQDVFPRYLLARKGTYLDIGSYRPTYHNNTMVLEMEGWKGLSLDCRDYSEEFKTKRTNPFMYADVTAVNWETIVNTHPFLKDGVDYISFDVDEATRLAVDHFPWDTIRFATMTIEHDQYRFGVETRDHIRKTLWSHGYMLVCSDVVMPDAPHEKYGAFEDWWVDPSQVVAERVNAIRCDSLTYLEIFKLIDPKPYAFYCPPPSHEE